MRKKFFSIINFLFLKDGLLKAIILGKLYLKLNKNKNNNSLDIIENNNLSKHCRLQCFKKTNQG